MNRDIYYCKGKGCAIKETCRRFTEGNNIDPDAQGYWWMGECDTETRDGYQPTSQKPP